MSGRVVFLPAPYQPDLDQILMDCINASSAGKAMPASAFEPTTTAQQEELQIELPQEPQPMTPSEPERVCAEPEASFTEVPVGNYNPTPDTEGEPYQAVTAPEPENGQEPVISSAFEEEPIADKHEPEEKIEVLHEHTSHSHKKKASSEAKAKDESIPESIPEALPEPIATHQASANAKDLMEKIEEISKPAVPEWCTNYSFHDLDKLREKLFALNEQIRLTQTNIGEVEGRIKSMEELKNSLLSADEDDLLVACTKVFEKIGWAVKPADANKSELWLTDGPPTAAIARVVRTASQVKRADLAQLAESVITYWGEHESEPKGVLIASTWVNRPPSERNEPDYTEALSEFAEKKHLCLMTTWQLLCIYRDVEGGYISAEDLKASILSTSGVLPGFVLEAGLAAAAAAS